MRREFHVRFCEGLGVRSPRATRLTVICSNEQDAHRLMAVLPRRFERFGLEVHPEKTRVVDFRGPHRRGGGPQGGGRERPDSFDFLGFTHYWGQSRRGRPVVKRKTSKSRLARAIKRISDWCRMHRHLPIAEQHDTLSKKMRGHDGYYGITNNSRALEQFRRAVTRVWRKWLHRRGGRRVMPWERFNRLLRRYPLPPARITRSVYRSAANPVRPYG